MYSDEFFKKCKEFPEIHEIWNYFYGYKKNKFFLKKMFEKQNKKV